MRSYQNDMSYYQNELTIFKKYHLESLSFCPTPPWGRGDWIKPECFGEMCYFNFLLEASTCRRHHDPPIVKYAIV